MAAIRSIVHFFLIGALLFVVAHALREPAERHGRRPLTPAVTELRDARQRWLALTGLLPDEGEMAALIDAAVDEELLLREAQRLGLRHHDPVVQRRLAQNLRLLGLGESGTDESLYRNAVALGLDRADVVVRRRLIQRMRLRIIEDALGTDPSEAELQEYLERERGRFVEPARVRVTHVFVDRVRRGPAGEASARALREQLRRAKATPDRVGQLGDAFAHPLQLPLKSAADLAKLFGREFADGVFRVPVQQWSEPLPSSYGWHVVWVHERLPERPQRLDEVRNRLRRALLDEGSRVALANALARMREVHGRE
jgi:hypothetical protein